MLKTKDLNLQILGVTPVLEDETGRLTPQQLVSLSALLTFKGKSVKELVKDVQGKGQDLEKKILAILKNSSLRGHASIATTPVFSFTYEASKFLDSMLTGIVFSSSLMASGRRTDTEPEDTVFPSAIAKKRNLKELYYQASKKNIATYRFLKEAGVAKDQTSRILHYGIYGTGIISLSVESFISFKREYQREKKWMPEEAGILIKGIEAELKNLGVDLVYATRSVAPRNIYPYPNIFKNPQQPNLARELKKKHQLPELTKVIDFQAEIPASLEKELRSLTRLNRAKKQKDWYGVQLKRRRLTRDFNSCLSFKTLTSCLWRVWGEKKRHRTVPQVVESVYWCIDRAWEKIREHQDKQKGYRFSQKDLKEINKVFSIPPAVMTKPEWTAKWIEAMLNSLETYYQLIDQGVSQRDAVFIIPRALRLDVLQQFDFYNLLVGYYPLRLCTTAEQEMHSLTVKEVEQLKKILKNKKLDFLSKHLVPKCHLTGFCPERQFCGQIKKLRKDYSKQVHKKVHQRLEKRFKKSLKNSSGG